MNVLVLMAGDSKRFEDAGYLYPKNLIEIAGLPLVERVIGQLDPLRASGGRLIVLVQEAEAKQFHTVDVIRLLVPEATVVTVPQLDSGAACTALLAIDEIDRDLPLLVFNGDQVLTEGLPEALDDFMARDLDGGVVVFPAVHPRWSYVKTNDDGLVVEASEKRPISRSATAGTYYFKRGEDFLRGAMRMIGKSAHVQGRYYVCPVYNELILEQARIGVYEIPQSAYFSLATPQGVQQYEEFLTALRRAGSNA
jgi:dTDP-glucose pyrophosphorylase